MDNVRKVYIDTEEGELVEIAQLKMSDLAEAVRLLKMLFEKESATPSKHVEYYVYLQRSL